MTTAVKELPILFGGCYKLYEVRIDYRRQCERTDLKPVPGMRQEIRYEK